MGNVNCNCIKFENSQRLDQSTFKSNDIIVFDNLPSYEEQQAVKIQANWKGHTVRSKYNNIKQIMNCPGVELLPDQPIGRTNKNIANTEASIGPYLNTQPLDTHLKFRSILYPDNSIYIGTYDKYWKKEGFGTLFLQDGHKYTGSFVNDRMCGEGRIIYPLGDYYEGEFYDDKPNGQGKFVKINEGVTYQGQWRDETKFGYGEEKNKDGSLYKGEHFNDMKHGKGIFKWPDGTIYEGDFVYNNIEGFGRILYSDNKIYLGEWKSGKIEGTGIFYWPDNKCYIGYYKSDKKNGFGILIYTSGKRYEGYWVNGNQHGFGFFSSKGITKLGEWRMGKRIRWVSDKIQEDVLNKQTIDDIFRNIEYLNYFCKKLNIATTAEAEQIKNILLQEKL